MSRAASMTPEELKAIVDEVYGCRGQRRMAADIERSEVTISRWMSGYMPVGSIEATLLRLLLVLHRHKVDWRKWVADNRKAATRKPMNIKDML